ncbi:MAG: hypothetical protein K2X25_13800 [Caulobacteraceae bacterium]|nr:hypothetical protein [Caulobacteraceae bacterium]
MTLRRRALFSTVAAVGALLMAAPALAQTQTIAADARTALSPGLRDAGQLASSLALEHSVAPPPGFFDPDALFAVPQTRAEREAFMAAARTSPPKYTPLALASTDMALSNGRLFVGNFHGFNAYDVTGGGEPKLVLSVVCPGGQGDLSVHGDLLFMSVEQNRGRLDCSVSDGEGDNAGDNVNAARFRGIRIFDISDLNAPRQIAAVQTCRGSHTHTLVPSPSDANVLYVYNSATAGVRPTGELSICSGGQPGDNPETALYSIDVIKVPLDNPAAAAIVNRPRIFADRTTGQIAGLWTGGSAGVASQDTAQTNHCHDITVFPEINRAAGACSGNGILLDISDPENPARIAEMFDPDMAYWHSATFDNTGTKVVFTDEWGGGIGARCTASSPATWGANLVATIDGNYLRGQSFHKLPSIQGPTENCVAHNGSLIPVPGRDLMIQAWYQGGLSVMDFTDPAKPVEIAFFDRGPIEADRLIVGGSWSAYWFNGRIYSSEIARGLDVLKLVAGDQLSAAEIAAAESVMATEVNPQTQTRIVWADSPDVAGAYLDQLGRTNTLSEPLAGQAKSVVESWRAGVPDTGSAAALARSLTIASASATGADKARMEALAGLFTRLAG